MATRVFVALSGSDDFSIIKVDLSGEEAAVRSRLIQPAAEELEVSIADESAVKIYLKDRLVKKATMVEKDDELVLFLSGTPPVPPPGLQAAEST